MKNSKDSLSIYKKLFETSTEGMLLTNSTGEIILVNDSLKKMFLYEEKDILYQQVEILIPKENKIEHVNHRKGFMTKPSRRTMGQGRVLFGLKKNGSKFPVEISLNYIDFDDERYAVALISDVSKSYESDRFKQKIEKTLREIHQVTSNHQFEIHHKITRLLNIGANKSTAIASAFYDVKNDQFFLGGEAKENLICLNKENKFIKDTLNSSEELFIDRVDFLKIGKQVKLENEVIGLIVFFFNEYTDDVSEIDIEILKMLSEWIAAELYRYNVQKQLKEINDELEQRVKDQTSEIRESEKMYKAVSYNFPDGRINILDENYNFIASGGMEVRSESNVGLGTIHNFLDNLYDKDKNRVKSYLEDAKKGKVSKFEIEYPNNQVYLVDIVLLSDLNETAKKILVIERNISKRKVIENEILENLNKERELNKLKSRFVSMASHEFRTPLATILSSVSIIEKYKREEEQEKRVKHINRIKSSVNNLNGILKDFLSYDQIETGKMEANLSIFDVSSFCSDVVDEVKVLLKTNQTISYEHLSELTSVKLDSHMIKNILINLISNAIKYSDNKLITVKSNIINNQLSLSVTDRGMGIPDDDQKLLFDQFFRAKNVMNITGTGLGLNIVKKYVDLLNGSIKFKSQLNVGTVFTVLLPINL